MPKGDHRITIVQNPIPVHSGGTNSLYCCVSRVNPEFSRGVKCTYID